MIKGSEIRELRRRLGLSLHSLSSLTGIDAGLICRFELNQHEVSPVMQRELQRQLLQIKSLQKAFAPARLDLKDTNSIKALVGKLESGHFEGYARLTSKRLTTLAQLQPSAVAAQVGI